MLATQILDKVTLSDSLPIINPTHKTCKKCHQTKLLCEFHKSKSGKYGVRSVCNVCTKGYCQVNKQRKSEYDKSYGKVWYKVNKERKTETCKVWRDKNPEYGKIWYQVNRERYLETCKTWKQNNPDKRRSQSARRRAAKLKAFPLWARTGEIKAQIDAIYTEAKDLELFHQTTYHVDHIHPLQNDFVCGLHVPVNLRPLVGVENISKSNSFTPYIENSSEIEIDMVELRKMVKDFLAIETWVTMYIYSKTILFLKLL